MTKPFFFSATLAVLTAGLTPSLHALLIASPVAAAAPTSGPQPMAVPYGGLSMPSAMPTPMAAGLPTVVPPSNSMDTPSTTPRPASVVATPNANNVATPQDKVQAPAQGQVQVQSSPSQNPQPSPVQTPSHRRHHWKHATASGTPVAAGGAVSVSATSHP